MSEVKVLSLLNGMEIIARCEKATDGVMKAKGACIIQIVPNPNGQVGLQLSPLMPLAEDVKGTVEFNTGAITYTYKPSTEIENQYQQVFGSGIIKAGPSLITS